LGRAVAGQINYYFEYKNPGPAAKFAKASAEAPLGPEGDLLGDFFIPRLGLPNVHGFLDRSDTKPYAVTNLEVNT